ncbi:hypothetical protein GCM10009821_23270 [Aeromicrobium halocynthiae]|uniref:S9 family peptidase n=1 Tax=Aeromicrobium halocynthiae TaxID=560557 RepID=A0ABN2W3N8_9ACTN
MTSSLLVSDHRAGWWRSVSTDCLLEPLPPARPATLAEHAGVLRLPLGAPARAVFADDARGALVVVRGASSVEEIPLAIPAEHLACDGSGRHVVCTTGAGASWEPWSDLVTIADLETGESLRCRVRVGEPGVAVVDGEEEHEPVVVLRHRQPGAVETIGLAAIRAAGPHCPVVRGVSLALEGDLGHGDALDRKGGVLYCATEAGLERVRITGGGSLERLVTWPWPVEGRAYFLRLDPVRRELVAALRGGPAGPTRWQHWRNHVATWRLDEESVDVEATDDGLVFRPDVLDGHVAWTVVHPDGDRLHHRRPDGQTLSTELPAMSAAPRPGATPWDAVDGRSAQRRALALLDGRRTAVTRGGDGELSIVEDGEITTTVSLETPVDEGGHLTLLPGSPPELVDGIGR